MLATVYSRTPFGMEAPEGQAADHDPEFARCLRSGVADAVSRQVEKLYELLRRLSGVTDAPPQ